MTCEAIERAIGALPTAVRRRSGSVFYTGRSAFESKHDLYILGLNPGGSPLAQAGETIGRDMSEWTSGRREHWSAYLDESWLGRPAGTQGIQPRLAHLFRRLGRDLRDTPAANAVFVRSPSEAALASEKTELLRVCWPVHQAVLSSLGIRVVVALGTTAGRWTREAMNADRRVAEFKEDNARGWTSQAHRAADGRFVVTLTHPGRVDWRNFAADPSQLVRDVLAMS